MLSIIFVYKWFGFFKIYFCIFSILVASSMLYKKVQQSMFQNCSFNLKGENDLIQAS